MLKPVDQYIEELYQDCEPLFLKQEQQVRDYWASNPSKENLIDHFNRRMINERINCIQLCRAVIDADENTSAEDLFLLSKQAHDEAKHFWFVKDIVEELTGQSVDIKAVYQDIRERQLSGEDQSFRPAILLEKFECSKDPLTLAVYQFVAEGMAARNWAMTAQLAKTQLMRDRYGEIAKDEKFHASLGRRSLAQLVDTEENQIRAKELVDEFLFLLMNQHCIRQHIPMSEIDSFLV
jgi:rubrerythrin